MNKRKIMASLNNIANHLDNNGMFNEATQITKVMSKLAQYPPEDPPKDYYGLDDDTYAFNSKLFNDLINALKKLLNPTGEDRDVVGEILEEHEIDLRDPSKNDMAEVFGHLEDLMGESSVLIDPQNETVFVNDKLGKMNYDQIASQVMEHLESVRHGDEDFSDLY